ncbi:MAG: hypothetical protein K2X98_03550, partial [Alphaproteobacteria bacterium]|nr:hypothetical protein [Alphaproteobacteria bacterium]
SSGAYAHNIKKVNDNFYVGKIKDQPLWLVMEHIADKSTLDKWKDYIDVQTNPRSVDFAPKGSKKFTTDGSATFRTVLNTTDMHKNEVWVAYITSNPNPRPIAESTGSSWDWYKAEQLFPPTNSFAKDISIFVTVTSSQNGLITSHRGVSISLEGLSNKVRGLSMDLHSFAAKVMLIRNPERQLMVNAPVLAMEKILAEAMPKGSVFAGTREMQQLLMERSTKTIDDFLATHPDLYEHMKDEATESLPQMIENFKNDLDSNEEDKKVIQRRFTRKLISEAERNAKISALDADSMWKKNALPGLEGPEGILKATEIKINEKYKKWKDPYSFDEAKENVRGLEGMESLLQWFEAYPPLISVDGIEGRDTHNAFTIYDKHNPTTPWLTIQRGNPDYDWMFDAMNRTGSTHYIAVDLDALAKLKPLDVMD